MKNRTSWTIIRSLLVVLSFAAAIPANAREAFTNSFVLKNGRTVVGSAVWSEAAQIIVTSSSGVSRYGLSEIEIPSVLSMLAYFGKPYFFQGSSNVEAVVVQTGSTTFDVALFPKSFSLQSNLISTVSLKMEPGSTHSDVIAAAQEGVSRSLRAPVDDAGTDRIGISPDECEARYGTPDFTTNDLEVFHVDDLLISVSFQYGQARAFSFRKAGDSILETPFNADEIDKILALFSGGKKWRKVDLTKIAWDEESGPKQADAMRKSMKEYQWKRSDGRLLAFYDRTEGKLVVLDQKFLRRTDADPSSAIDRL